MMENKKKIEAFVGFQIKSEYHNVKDIESMITKLEKRLADGHDVELQTKYGTFPPGGILWDDVKDSIYNSDISIFDISENNSNVMIEVGLAYGFGKQVFMLKNKESFEAYPTPSDLAAIYIPYDNKNALNRVETIKQLEKGILAYLKETHQPTYYFKSLWGYDEYDSVLVICSELDEPEKRQHPVPNEYIYLSKYGDVDSLVEVLVTLHRLYPHLDVKFHSADEVKAIPNEFTGNIILIGGPDYNRITGLFDQYSPYEYLVGATDEDISIMKKSTEEVYIPKIEAESCRNKIVDYGFFLKMKNPYNHKKKLIMIGGPHTYGVFGAIKAFSYWGGTKDDLSYTNCKEVVDTLGHDPDFCALFEVHGIESSVLTPKLNVENLESLT